MWIVCQIGAREHYAVPRALHRVGQLGCLVTDFWVPPGVPWAKVPGVRPLRDRFHSDLTGANVLAANGRFLAFEFRQRLMKNRGWPGILERNRLFQQIALKHLSSESETEAGNPETTTLFSYSYAARDLFRLAKQRGWQTVLGQIDPGPEEERIVAVEHGRYAKIQSRWQPAPACYWESWREEIELADRIIVNSEWSRECLLNAGVPREKIEVVPLVYEGMAGGQKAAELRENSSTTRVLFLGQINLRKGMGRLLDAMRMLKNEPFELLLAGPTEIDPSAWEDLPNVKWMGPIPRSEVGTIYQSADVFILPTLSDGYALTQLEALSFGRPVIASKQCGAAVTHGQNGWVLDDLEPETIAATLRAARHERVLDIRPPGFSWPNLSRCLLSLH